ncbi:MAG TPA: N-6 DNA methylase [bacterium]|nr:N-6 DNA methylase [bacterium]
MHVEGAILPPDLLQRIAAGDPALEGLTPESYHLIEGEKINEVTSRSWNRLLGAWTAFQEHLARLPENDAATSITREKWLLHLFRELGYGRLAPAKAIELGDKTYPVSHTWQTTPIHLVGWGVDLDKRTAGVAGASRSSPHSMMQELLNRSGDLLWALLANGRKLRILRDNVSLTRQAWVEFDLEAMMQGEVYADFVLLWLLCHQSRLEADHPENCMLERWSRAAQEQGARALDQLRSGVESAITALGRGFLRHPGNKPLRQRLYSGELDKQDYYRQLLRLVYRLIFLFVAEERRLLLLPDAPAESKRRYYDYYSTRRLRNLAARRRGSKHADLYQGLCVVLQKLGNEGGCPELALPALGTFLFSGQAAPDLDAAQIANHDLLEAIRHLAVIIDGRSRRQVDYKNLGSEELGSVYESLLELHPRLELASGDFSLHTAGGHERKSTGSYYTPSSLIQELLDSALDPVLDAADRQPDPEAAILGLKICDPACGSGHFLIAAAHRIAHRLAAAVTGESEPAPEALRAALRRVIGHCIYGVDINEMAVELCKVGLWLEALEPGKPLSFLDHHIQCGNSLLGATPELMAAGIPDEAFSPIEGDDKTVCNAARRLNKSERETGQADLFYAASAPWQRLGDFAGAMAAMDRVSDETLAGYRSKSSRYQEIVHSPAFLFGCLLADLWCAAFVWKKTCNFPYVVTNEVFRTVEREPGNIPTWMYEEVERLRRQYGFFHWHLAFPEVFAAAPSTSGEPADRSGAGPTAGGFDVILGNPPWERIKLQEKEWFAERRPDIAAAANAAQRRKMIEALQESDPALWRAFAEDRRKAEGESMLVRNSGRYPLCGRGDVNTYTIFTELNRTLINANGRVGCIVPSGIATDDTTKFFFQDLIARSSLVSLYDFENRDGIFIGVHRSYKFCLLTLTGSGKPNQRGAEFIFFAHQTADLSDPERRFVLTAHDIALLNPNTRTCPIFRGRRDAELTRYIYRRVPVLIDESQGESGNPWGITFLRMFDMSNDSHLFRERKELEKAGWQLQGNVFVRGQERALPLYEAKMIHHYDHRWATYTPEGDTRDLTPAEKRRPDFAPLPRYWVEESHVTEALAGRWDKEWLIAYRWVARSTDERTYISAIVPYAAFGNSAPVMIFQAPHAASIALLLSSLSSFVFDYNARQKLGGANMTFGTSQQLPILPPRTYSRPCPWVSAGSAGGATIGDWFLPRVLELVYTSHDLAPFARDCGYDGPHFKWDKERRFQLRCELDAAFFHLYLGTEQEWREKATPELLNYFPSPRDAVEYILDTFLIVKRKDEQQYGEFRTQRNIVSIYDQMKPYNHEQQP